MDGTATGVPVLIWHGCYDASWRGLIVPAAFAHPAKFGAGLIDRIITHGLAVGWWKAGDAIGDPFAGVGCGGIVAAYHGLAWKGVELEPRFVALAKENFDLHDGRWRTLGAPLPELFTGDSRQFARIVRASAIVTSPPYAETSVEKNSYGVDRAKQYETYRRAGGGASFEKFCATQERHSLGYGSSAGQIGALRSGDVDAVLTSPPYVGGGHSGNQVGGWGGCSGAKGGNATKEEGGYGDALGQIGRLPPGPGVHAVVTSPPFGVDQPCAGQTSQPYADSTHAGDAGETYWSAMKQVYGQCLLALRPSGVLCVVMKDFVQRKQRVPLCDQTLALLLHLGFAPVCRIRAMLVKESSHAGLFGYHVERKSRKSFFRRLAEKNGSPSIDHEEVIVVRKEGR